MELKELLESVHFASFGWMLLIPCAMMAIDVITGVTNAVVQKDFKSAIMRAGLGKKVGEISIIVMGILLTFGMSLPEYILSGIVVYIVFMETVSVVENLDKLGVPLPGFVKRTINNVSDALQEDSLEELNEKIAELEKLIDERTDVDDGR